MMVHEEAPCSDQCKNCCAFTQLWQWYPVVSVRRPNSSFMLSHNHCLLHISTQAYMYIHISYNTSCQRLLCC
jgi:hypothetical protein